MRGVQEGFRVVVHHSRIVVSGWPSPTRRCLSLHRALTAPAQFDILNQYRNNKSACLGCIANCVSYTRALSTAAWVSALACTSLQSNEQSGTWLHAETNSAIVWRGLTTGPLDTPRHCCAGSRPTEKPACAGHARTRYTGATRAGAWGHILTARPGVSGVSVMTATETSPLLSARAPQRPARPESAITSCFTSAAGPWNHILPSHAYYTVMPCHTHKPCHTLLPCPTPHRA